MNRKNSGGCHDIFHLHRKTGGLADLGHSKQQDLLCRRALKGGYVTVY